MAHVKIRLAKSKQQDKPGRGKRLQVYIYVFSCDDQACMYLVLQIVIPGVDLHDRFTYGAINDPSHSSSSGCRLPVNNYKRDWAPHERLHSIRLA